MVGVFEDQPVGYHDEEKSPNEGWDDGSGTDAPRQHEEVDRLVHAEVILFAGEVRVAGDVDGEQQGHSSVEQDDWEVAQRSAVPKAILIAERYHEYNSIYFFILIKRISQMCTILIYAQF